MMWPRVDFLPSAGLHKEPELWYQQWPLAPIDLLRECRQIWVSLSWFLNLLYWLRFWVLLDSGAGYLPPPRRNDTGVRGARWNIQGIPTHGPDTEWGSVERYEKFPLSQKIPDGGLAERCQENSNPVERYWVRGLNWKKIKDYPGLHWKMLKLLCCRGLKGPSWVVK